jgi:DNA-binding CsgD family transcriptional regulator
VADSSRVGEFPCIPENPLYPAEMPCAPQVAAWRPLLVLSMKRTSRPAIHQFEQSTSSGDGPGGPEHPVDARMRVLLVACNADDAQRTLKSGERTEVAYLPSYDLREIQAEIERFKPQLVTCSTDVFLRGISVQVADGVVDVGPETTDGNMGSVPNVAAREMRVLRMIAKGRTNDEIAAALHVSSRTVKRILSILFERLSANNRTELVSRATRLRLLDSEN